MESSVGHYSHHLMEQGENTLSGDFKIESITLDPTAHVRELLRFIGEDPKREGLLDTPKRVIKSYKELFRGYNEDPKTILATDFERGKYDQMILLKDIELQSMCEHHMLPFIGKAHVAYIPGERVVGLSKLARVVDCFARRLQIQEKLTEQIADSIFDIRKCKGVGVVVEAHHSCMSARGVNKKGATMMTSALRGNFLSDGVVRAEFLSSIRG